MPLFFHKEILTSAVYHGGKPLVFTPVEDANGILQTDDAELGAKLTDMATRRVGGIRILSAEQFEELKKKPTLTQVVTETRYGNSGPRLIANSVPMSKASQQTPAPPVAGLGAVSVAAVAAPAASAMVEASSAPSKPPIATRKGKAAAAKPSPTPSTV